MMSKDRARGHLSLVFVVWISSEAADNQQLSGSIACGSEIRTCCFSSSSQSFSLSYQRSRTRHLTKAHSIRSPFSAQKKTTCNNRKDHQINMFKSQSEVSIAQYRQPRKRQKKKPPWHEYNRALWEDPRPERFLTFFFSFHHRLCFCGLHFHFPQPNCSNRVFFTVNQSYVMKASLLF